MNGLGAAVKFRQFMADRPGMGNMVPFHPPQERSPGLPQEIYGLSGLGSAVKFRQFMADRPGMGRMMTARRMGAIARKNNLKRARPQFLGDTSGDIAYNEAVYSTPPVSIDLTSELSDNPIDVGEINTGDAPDVNMPNTGSAGYPYNPGSPVATAANTGVSSTPVASAIGSVIGAASSVYMTSQQAALQNSIVQTNLQRAAAGLPPLNTSLSASGVPIVSSTGTLGSSGMLLMLLGGGLLLWAVAG
jgi:hypothetical protein